MLETDISYDMIYTSSDGRQCAVVFTPGYGAEVNEQGLVEVGFLVDGQFVDLDKTERAWVAPDQLVPYERLNGIDKAPVIDFQEFRRLREVAQDHG